MANNYTLFSVSLGKLTNAEREWLRAEYARKHEEMIPDPGCPGELVENAEYDPDAGTCDIEMYPDEVIVYSDECGDGEVAAALIQGWLKEFHPKQWLVLEIVNSCSKARPGEFGAAVVVIRASHMHWMDTGTWATQKAKQLQLKPRQRVF